MRIPISFHTSKNSILAREYVVAIKRSYASMRSAFKPTELITVDELKAEMDRPGCLNLIDTRSRDEFATGHITGSVNIPFFTDYLITDSKPDSIKKLQDDFVGYVGETGISPTDRVVVYDSTLDKTSPRAHFLLRYLGFNNVSLLNGGLALWRKHNLPLSSEPEAPKPTTFQPDIVQELMATREDVLRVLRNPGSATIVDDRNEPEWTGESSSPYGVDFCPRKGRIPGAIWIEWQRLMAKDIDGVSVFKSPDEIGEICRDSGATDLDKPVLVYCFKGARASNTWFAMRLAGYKDVKVYFGSWNEWSRDTNLPVDDTILKIASN